jgi:hypothetical protein
VRQGLWAASRFGAFLVHFFTEPSRHGGANGRRRVRILAGQFPEDSIHHLNLRSGRVGKRYAFNTSRAEKAGEEALLAIVAVHISIGLLKPIHGAVRCLALLRARRGSPETQSPSEQARTTTSPAKHSALLSFRYRLSKVFWLNVWDGGAFGRCELFESLQHHGA